MSTKPTDNDSKIHVEQDEKHLLLDHDYDGIQELNHPLPKWWNIIFYASVFFGLGYFFYYVLMGGPSLRDEFSAEMSKVKIAQQEYQKLNSAFSQTKFDEFNKPDNVQKGLAVYINNCQACHQEAGRGDVGPNLTDDAWIHLPGNVESNYNIIYKGVDEKGMPAWGEVLSSEDIYLALVYLESIRNTFDPKGKAPQGEKVVQEKPL